MIHNYIAKKMEALVKFAAQLSSEDNDAVVDEGYNGNKNNNDNDDIINNTLSSFGLIANNNNNNNNSLNNKKINNVNNNNNNNNNNSNNSSNNCNGYNKANNINSTICSSGIKKKKRVQYKHKRKNIHTTMSSPSTASSLLPPKKKKISGHALSGLTVPRKWHQWEDDALVTAVKRYSCKSWKLIANHVPGRNHVQCLQRWKKVLKPGLKKGTWDKTEDQLLIRVYHEEVARQKQRKKLFLKLKAENDKIQIEAEEARQKEREQRRLLFLQLKEQQEKYGNVNVNVNATTTTTSISLTNADGTISTTNTANEVDKISATGSPDLKLTGEKDTLVSSTTTNLINNDAIVEFNENNIKEGMIKEGIVYKFTMDDVGGNIINWPSIASKIKGRTTKQCRERWYNHLDPTIKRGNWSYEEDNVLLNEQARLGNKWSKISSMLEGRTENAVKIRWKSLTRVSKHNKHANKTIFDYTKKRTGQKKASSSKSRASLDMLVGNPSASHYLNLPMPSEIQTGQIPNLFYNVPVLTLQQQELARQRHQVVQQQQQQQLLLHNQMQKLCQQQQQQLLALHLLQQQQQHAQDTSSATSSTITSSSSSSSSSNDNNDNNNNTSNNNSGIANLSALISSNNNCLLNPTPRPEGTIAPPIVPLLTAAIGGISNMENQSALSPLTGIGRNNNNGNNNNNY